MTQIKNKVKKYYLSSEKKKKIGNFSIWLQTLTVDLR